MGFRAEFLDEDGIGGLDEARVSRLCALAFSELGYEPDELGEVSVVLVWEEDMKNLNQQFRSRDYPTDVLSFTMDGPGGEMVGEVVICPERAEMGLDELVVHGTLHLSGLDHGDDFESSEMCAVQERVMRRFELEASE